MVKYLFALSSMFVAATVAAQIPSPNQGKPAPATIVPIIAPMWSGGGMELVITPNAEKLALLGLKPEDLRVLQYRRFIEDEWLVTVKNRKIRLDQVAALKMRKLFVPQFTVDLPDGRQAVITPNADRIAPYHVSGRYFEEEVRMKLSDLFVAEPSQVNVLYGLRVGGDVPNFWGADHIHISTGEPLERFADVKIQGEPGPQIADLERMKSIRKLAEDLVDAEQSTPRSEFEAKFGTVPENESHYHIYPIAESRIQVEFGGHPEVVTHIYYLEGYSPPPEGIAARARSVIQIDRDFLLAFLRQKFRHANQQERDKLKVFLDSSESLVSWTDAERKQLLDFKAADD